jgi:DNA mismatch endonuclease (patch repair protein)
VADRVTKEQRSYIMSRIRSRDTKPEIAVRSLLHRMGFRFSLGGRGLPGRPDIVLPKWAAVVFVHGCFWHAHACRPASEIVPKTRRRYWANKFIANVIRDGMRNRESRRCRTEIERVPPGAVRVRAGSIENQQNEKTV